MVDIQSNWWIYTSNFYRLLGGFLGLSHVGEKKIFSYQLLPQAWSPHTLDLLCIYSELEISNYPKATKSRFTNSKWLHTSWSSNGFTPEYFVCTKRCDVSQGSILQATTVRDALKSNRSARLVSLAALTAVLNGQIHQNGWLVETLCRFKPLYHFVTADWPPIIYSSKANGLRGQYGGY